MDNGCMNAHENMYFRCRKEAAAYNDTLRSREGASELLGVSVSSLADYELGNTKVVPVDKVVLMADLYRAPELLNQYCKHECPIGCRKQIVTEVKSLESITIGLIAHLSGGKLERYIEDLAHIAVDGKVDETEKDKMSEVIGYMSQLKFLSEELMLFDAKRKGEC